MTMELQSKKYKMPTVAFAVDMQLWLDILSILCYINGQSREVSQHTIKIKSTHEVLNFYFYLKLSIV
jgi:hypothetical protein